MSFPRMNSREKTAVAILGAIILIALIGIGLLIAKLAAGSGLGGQEGGITLPPATGVTQPGPTVTLVAPPSLEGLSQTPPGPVSSEPLIVARQESVGPLAPAIVVAQPLHAGRRYRLEVTTSDGSPAAVHGSWSQAAASASGNVAPPQIEFFEGTTPYRVDIVSPVPDPSLWSCSASAGLKSPDILGTSPNVVITIWDVTGTR